MSVRSIWFVLTTLLAAIVYSGCSERIDIDVPEAGAGDAGDEGIDLPMGEASVGTLQITPANPTLQIKYGETMPAITFQATLDGQPVMPAWDVDRGELATILMSGELHPTSGKLGGTATVTAKAGNGATGTTTVKILVSYEENGDENGGPMPVGPGGWGGVGGEGPGKPVSNTLIGVLKGSPVNDASLAWLYPYDKTVWPRGILSPLLQWSSSSDYDAIYVHAYEGAFDYKGYFARTATPFVHHPIVEDAWKALEYSNEGEELAVDLVFAKGNTAYGPITEKWKIAKGSLLGTVYYQSYGTNLVHNSGIVYEQNYNYVQSGTGPQYFGAGTLAVKHGSTDPVLVSGSDTKCRVCHSVSADGSTMITQAANGFDNSASSAFNLKTNTETPMMPANGSFGWPAIFPDGTFLFSQAQGLAVGNSAPSGLFAIPAGTPITSNGLPQGLQALTPTFSPDGKLVAFNWYGGSGADQKSLCAMSFNATTKTFSGFTKLDTPQTGIGDVYPAFFPTGSGIVFERETVHGTDSGLGWTRGGARGELWWVDRASKVATRLDQMNGKNALPTGPNNHGDDATLNYEPTVNPVVSGGYVWVVFTSRRLYGNVATIDPYWSYPQEHDLSTTPTTKKLWVAAIDLNAKSGTDASHPAFYLPGQELLAGNSRGYWVVDPCKQDGNSCETGDECCGGYCRQSNNGLVCQPGPNGCAQHYDKCASDGDCCMGFQCIGGRCDFKVPQ